MSSVSAVDAAGVDEALDELDDELEAVSAVLVEGVTVVGTAVEDTPPVVGGVPSEEAVCVCVAGGRTEVESSLDSFSTSITSVFEPVERSEERLVLPPRPRFAGARGAGVRNTFEEESATPPCLEGALQVWWR